MAFKVHTTQLNFSTRGEIEFVDLTSQIQEVAKASGIREGIIHVFAPHATGVLILTENDEPLLKDIKRFLEQILPRSEKYGHPYNAHAHLRSILLAPDKTLPVINGAVLLGTWQSIFFVETDTYPRKRTIVLQVIGQT